MCIRDRFNGVKLARADKYNITGSDSAFVKVYGNESDSFFDYYNFQLRVPVKGDKSEVQRDRAEISIVGKFRNCV